MKKICVLWILLLLCFGLALAEGTGSVTVDVFRDSNNNGDKGKYERPLPDTQVMLSRTDGTAIDDLMSNKDGLAQFRDVPAGEYTITVSMPFNYGFGKKGGADAKMPSITDQSYERVQVSAPFTVKAGEDVKLYVSAMHLASVSGRVWMDENGDGIMKNEPGVANVKIVLYNKMDPTFMYTAFTDEDGNFSIFQVREGTYRLRVTCPDGLMFTKYTKSGGKNRSLLTTEGKTVDAVTLEIEQGDEIAEKYVGMVQQGSIKGKCFLDANYNGLYDKGEEVLSGVKLTLTRQKTGVDVAEAVSNEKGNYTFPCLRDGSFKVTALLPEGYSFTVDVPGGNLFKAREDRRSYTVQNVAVKVGEVTNLPVGAVKYGAISGVAYLDDNFSGTRDGSEKTVSGIFVRLHDENGNILVKERTNANGRYTFENVAPGTYYITAAAKAGYAYTKLGAGNVMVNDSEGEGHSEPFRVQIASNLENMNLGMIRPGTISGTFFADRNDNGRQDAGEGGLAGTVVRLVSDEGEHFSAVIGESGSYKFDAVMPGTYRLRFEMPEDSVAAQVTAGGNTMSGTGNVIESPDFTFSVAQTYNAPLAGGLTLGAIEGIAWQDTDGSGTPDEGESLMAGVILTLTPSRSDLEPVIVTTGEAGVFRFRQLHPDRYTLRVTCPSGMVVSRTGGLTLPLHAGESDQYVEIDLRMGDRYTAQQLGVVAPGALAGVLWLDENNNGLRDEGEGTLPGLNVEVIDELTGGHYATLTTDETGAFRRDGMVPGAYTLRFALTGELRAPEAGDSTFTEEGGYLVMKGVLAKSGKRNVQPVLGLVRYNTISGQVWVDRGSEIAPLAGAAVTLMTDKGETLQAGQTGAGGSYAFTGLLPGKYAVSVNLPEGQIVVQPDDERLSGGLTSVMKTTKGRKGSTGVFTLTMTGDYTGWDIGAVLPGRIGDLAWLDENGNGLQDSGEYGLRGVTIELLRGGEVVGEAVTDQYGYWLIDDVYPAVYTLRVTPPATVKPTKQNKKFALINSVLLPTDDETAFSEEVTVESDRTNRDCDLGFVLRKKGVYPDGYGTFDKQNWTKIIDPSLE